MSEVKLCDVAFEHKETIKNQTKEGIPVVGLKHLTTEDVRLTKWDINTENTFTKVFRKGCVLFGRRRAYLKKAAYAHFDGVCSGDIIVIEPKKDRILPELLPFVIQNDDLFDYAVGKSAGSLSPRVKWENLKNFVFELPKLEEQKELAKLLWSIQDTIEAYKNMLIKTDDFIKSQINNLIPEDGLVVKLKDYIDYKAKSKIKAGMGSESGEFPLFNSSSEQTLWVDEWLYDDETIFIPTGGKAAINFYSGKCSGTTDNIVFNCKNGFLTKFVYLFLWSNLDILQNGFKGSGLEHISKDYVENISIKVPSLDIQNKIINLSNKADSLKRNLMNSIENLSKAYRKILNNNLNERED